MGKKILMLDDDAQMRDLLAEGLGNEGFDVAQSDGLLRCFAEVQRSPPDIILADYELRDGNAFELLSWLKARDIRIPVIVLTGHATLELAVSAVKNGAEHFIPKPVDLPFLFSILRRTLEDLRIRQKDEAGSRERARYARDPFLGISPAIQELSKSAKRASESDITVLIQGETGTGKGVLARWLHKASARANEPFVDLNCAGMSGELFESEIFGHQKGAFTGAMSNKLGFLEAANHGTLFLDEIGDMDLQVQPKILKVVEEKRFYRLGDVLERQTDARIVAASHRDLKKLAEAGTFRSDLYFRISILRLRIPPLRERAADIPVITDRLLEQLGSDMKRGPLRISDDARTALLQYTWPGNVRELRNVLERAALLTDNGMIDRIGLEFEAPSRHEPPVNHNVNNRTLREIEKSSIVQTLEAEGGNVIRAARILGIHRSSLYAKIREYGL